MKETEIVARIKEIAERLNQLFPEAYRPERTPEEQVVFTILSQKVYPLVTRCIKMWLKNHISGNTGTSTLLKS